MILRVKGVRGEGYARRHYLPLRQSGAVSTGREMDVLGPRAEDYAKLRTLLVDYCQRFSLDLEAQFERPFIKPAPLSFLPCGNLYCP